jgi:hypothetical protein
MASLGHVPAQYSIGFALRCKVKIIGRDDASKASDRRDTTQREDPLRPNGAKLKVTISKSGEVEIVGNQLGLAALSNICAELSRTVGEPGNHYHFMDNEGFWGTEPGLVNLVVYGENW